MTDRRSQTELVLDEMVAGIMGVKATKAQLTPVGTETAKLVSFPSDLPGAFMSKEGMRDAAKDLRRWSEELVRIADGLDALSGFTTTEVVDTTKADTKAAERAADARIAAAKEGVISVAEKATGDFAASFDKLKAEAQAAVFGDVTDEAPPAVVTTSEWTCPTHGDEDIRQETSGSGRKYKACGVPNCKHFERKR